jgi:hypothetical protein
MKTGRFGPISGISIRDLARRRNSWPSLAWGVPLIVASAAAFCAAGPASPVNAQMIEARGAALRPGQSVWRADLAPAGPVAVVIGIEEQLAYVYRGGKLLGISTVSTGKRGKGTPTGEFTILQKKVFHRSNLYSNAPMPYMQRLTWTGIAMHAGQLPGYPASHGCIRFPADFAKKLYDATEMGGAVRIVASLGAMPGLPMPNAPKPAPAPDLPPLIVADAGSIARHDDAARAGADSAAPRIAIAQADTSFDAYDAVYASGYGAKGGTN